MGIPGPRLTRPTFISLEYLAGHLDADGSFSVHHGCSPCVRLCNTYPYVGEYLEEMFGGALRRTPPRTPTSRALWEWAAYGDEAILVAAALRDHLIEKQPQADILLMIRDYPKRSAMRRELLNTITNLKRHAYERTNNGTD